MVADTAIAVGETSLVTITFSEPVTGFTLADLTVANGSLSGLSTSDNITYTATFTPSAGISDTTNLITLNNTGVVDGAGNVGSGTTDSNNYVVDTLRPTATIVVADTALSVGETSLVTITFSEAVTGFDNSDLSVANGTLSAVSSSDGGITWTATFTPALGVSDTSNLIVLNNTGVSDAAGNTGTGTTNSNNYQVDTNVPTATIVIADTTLSIGEIDVGHRDVQLGGQRVRQRGLDRQQRYAQHHEQHRWRRHLDGHLHTEREYFRYQQRDHPG